MNEVYLMAYDENGKIINFYPKNLLYLYSSIPSQVIEINEETHQLVLQDGYKVINNELVKEVI